MDSIRNPFFASAVATVDRVLAAQVTSIFSTQILNNLKPSDIGAAADSRRMMFWKNLLWWMDTYDGFERRKISRITFAKLFITQ